MTASVRLKSDTFRFPSYHQHLDTTPPDQFDGICRVEIVGNPGFSLVTITELPENKGTSAFNRLPQIATLVLKEYHLPPCCSFVIKLLAPPVRSSIRPHDLYYLVGLNWMPGRQDGQFVATHVRQVKIIEETYKGLVNAFEQNP